MSVKVTKEYRSHYVKVEITDLGEERATCSVEVWTGPPPGPESFKRTAFKAPEIVADYEGTLRIESPHEDLVVLIRDAKDLIDAKVENEERLESTIEDIIDRELN